MTDIQPQIVPAMKTIYKFAVPGLIVCITLSYSCKKLLDQQPTGYLSSAVLANKNGVDGLLIGAYSMLDGYAGADAQGASWESSITDWIYGGIASDDAYKGSNSTDQQPLAPIETHTADPSNEFFEAKWAALYNGVQRANDVIRELPQVKDGSVTPAYAAEVTAEARFLRGIYHLEAAKLWRNVPYVDETVTYGNNNYNVPNPGPIWDKIEADFTAAMSVLPKTQPQVGRCNFYAAEAFLAKVLVYDHQYSKAMPFLNDLVTNGQTSAGVKYALGPYEDNFNAAKKNGPESVFAVQMTVNDGSDGNNGDPGDVLNFPAGTYTSCCGFYQPSYSLANAFKTDANGLPMLGTTTTTVTDIIYNNQTKTVNAALPNYDLVNLPNDHGLLLADAFTPPTNNLDPRIDWTLGRRGIPYLDWGLCGGETWSRGDIVPYNPIKNVFWHAQQASTTDNFAGWATNQDVANNYNLIRFADVILWRAECEVELNSLAAAEADVNLIRNRMAQHPEYWVHTYVDNTNPAAGFTNTPAANYVISPYNGQFAANGQAYAREAVHAELQLEFGMEGHRFFDLQRWDPIYGGPEADGYMAGIENNYIAADTRILNPILEQAVFTAKRNELYPIPLQEIDREAGQLKQNTGY